MTDTRSASKPRSSAGSDRSDAASRLQQATGHRGPRLRRHLGRRFAARRTRRGWSPFSMRRRRCRWPPASSTSGRRRPDRSPSRSTASTRPTRAVSCWASASAIPRRITEYTQAVRRADRVPRPARRVRRARQDRRVVAALGPQVLKLSARAQRRRAPVPDDARAHRAGPRADRPVGVPRARAQGGADHRSRRRRAPSAARRSRSTSTWPTTSTAGSGWASPTKTSPSRAATAWSTRSSPTARRRPSRRG